MQVEDAKNADKWIAGVEALPCTEIQKEFVRYRWKEPPKSGEETRESPIKRDDHLLDALRYAVMARPHAPRVKELDDRTPLQRILADDIARAGRKRDFDPMLM